jgi:hypothetical protein
LNELFHASADFRDRVGWINLTALLTLLTSKDPAVALTVYDETIAEDKTCTPGGAYHEGLTLASLLLLYRHSVVLKHATKQAFLRERVEGVVEMYPSSSIILGLFLEVERGQGIWGRVRGLLGEMPGLTKDISRKVQEIWMTGWERGRWNSEVERTRNGLIGATERDRCVGPVLFYYIHRLMAV